MKRLVIGIAALAVLAVAGQAGAATYPVFLGEQQPCGFIKCSGVPAGIPKGTSLDRFLPSAVTINAGDSVTYSSASFHTVAYGKPAALLLPDPAKAKYGALNDAAGKPFYFVGLPRLIYNPASFGPFGPHTISGSTATSSGVLSPAGPRAKPATFTYSFPKPGTYKLFCTIHPGMVGTVIVKPAGTPVPKSPAQVQAQALTDQTAAWSEAIKEAAAVKTPANTVDMGIGGKTTIFAYFPQSLKVKVGTTVTFVNKSPSEVHNVVFGPQKYIEGLQRTTDLFPMGPKSPNQVAPFLVFGSEPKGGYTYDGATHGNGFFSTPLTAGSKTIPLPHSSQVTFSKAGTYKYFCWIHGSDMAGTVVVTP